MLSWLEKKNKKVHTPVPKALHPAHDLDLECTVICKLQRFFAQALLFLSRQAICGYSIIDAKVPKVPCLPLGWGERLILELLQASLEVI